MSRPRFTRRDRAAVVDGKRESHGPEDDTPDAFCADCIGTGFCYGLRCMNCPSWPHDRWPNGYRTPAEEAAEQQEKQEKQEKQP